MNGSVERVRPRPAWLRTVARALLTGAVVGILTSLGLAVDAAAGIRADALDRAYLGADPHPDVVVVAIDHDHLEAVRAGRYFAIGSLRAIVHSSAATIVATRDGVAAYSGYLAGVGVTAEQASLITAQLAQGEATDRWVTVRYEPALEPAPEGSSLPTFPDSPLVAPASAGTLQAFSETLGHDGTGTLRTVPLAATSADDATTVIPSAGLLALERAADLEPDLSERRGELRFGDRRIPTEGDQELRVSYADELLPGGAQVMPMNDLLDIWTQPGFGDSIWGAQEPPFEGQTVFFGVTDPDIAEMIPTPAGPQPAVIVEANAANTLLTEQYLQPIPHWQLAVAAGIVAFLVALATLLLPIWLTPLAPILGGWAWWSATWQLADDGHLGDPVVGFGAVAAAFVAALGWRAARELRRRREVAGLFSRYVPDTVAHQLIDTGLVDDVVAGQRLDVTVLFCDLRGFTALAARLDPTDVRRLLDHYYEYTSQLILDHGGTLMQYVGDEVFAVWGAPLTNPDHAQHALDAATAIQTQRDRLDTVLRDDALPQLHFGIGLNTGEVVAAHTGSTTRRQYSVLGDPVNIAARLCSIAEPDQIVLADATRERLRDTPPALHDTGPLDLKGVRPDYHAWRYAPTALPATDIAPSA